MEIYFIIQTRTSVSEPWHDVPGFKFDDGQDATDVLEDIADPDHFKIAICCN